MIDIVLVSHRPGPETIRMFEDGPSLCGTPSILHYLDNTGNSKNLSEAWNSLAARGNAPYIAFLNCDAIPSSNWGLRLTRALEQAPDAAFACPHAVYTAQNLFLRKPFTIVEPPSRNTMRELTKYADALHPSDEKFQYFAGPATMFCVVIQRSDFEIAGGFDERFRFYGQDHDLQKRFQARKRRGVLVLSCAFYPGHSGPTQRAIANGDINIESEYSHCNQIRARLDSQELKAWDALTAEERRATRKDPLYRISKGMK